MKNSLLFIVIFSFGCQDNSNYSEDFGSEEKTTGTGTEAETSGSDGSEDDSGGTSGDVVGEDSGDTQGTSDGAEGSSDDGDQSSDDGSEGGGVPDCSVVRDECYSVVGSVCSHNQCADDNLEPGPCDLAECRVQCSVFQGEYIIECMESQGCEVPPQQLCNANCTIEYLTCLEQPECVQSTDCYPEACYSAC